MQSAPPSMHDDRDVRPDDRGNAAWRDTAVIVSVSLAAAIVCVRFDVSEALLGWTRLHERLQLDELPAVLLVIAICLVWFSLRRFGEANRELDLRKRAEGRLVEALAENQRLAQQYVDVQEAERKALARDLHDELGQYVNVMKLDAVAIRDSHAADPVIHRSAWRMIESIDRMYDVVAGLIRRLRPAGLDELGVMAALEHWVEEWRIRQPHTLLDMSVAGSLEGVDESRALVLFRLVQEALTNVTRHAEASRVDIRIARLGAAPAADRLDVTITDDGRGTELGTPRRGLGLVGMRERVVACGGSLRLESRPNGGFTVSASWPVHASHA